MTGCPGLIDRTLALSVWSRDSRHMSPASNTVCQISTVILLTGHCTQTDRTLSLQRPVVSSKVLETNFHARLDSPSIRSLNVSSECLTSAYVSTDRTHPASVRSQSDPVSDRLTDASVFTVIPDRTRRSNRGQRPVTPSDHRLFCLGCRWHRRTVRTQRADTPLVEFLTFAPKLHHP